MDRMEGYVLKLRQLGEFEIAAAMEQLAKEKAQLLEDLKKAERYGDCEFCVHTLEDHAEDCEACDFDCEKCKAQCICNTCTNCEKWEWRGLR